MYIYTYIYGTSSCAALSRAHPFGEESKHRAFPKPVIPKTKPNLSYENTKASFVLDSLTLPRLSGGSENESVCVVLGRPCVLVFW